MWMESEFETEMALEKKQLQEELMKMIAQDGCTTMAMDY